MPSTIIEKETLELLLRDEKKIIEALEEHYDLFDTSKSVTFNLVVHKRGLNPVYVDEYRFYRKGYKNGVAYDNERVPLCRVSKHNKTWNIIKHPKINSAKRLICTLCQKCSS